MENAPSRAAPVYPARNATARFWLVIVLTGLGTGASAAALTLILQAVQHHVWPGADMNLLDAASQATPWRHVLVLVGAGLATGAGQIILVRLASGNGIDITAAIWFSAGRLPALRTLGSAVLSVIVVGMGASLGREGAPKQAGAVVANILSDQASLSDEQRRLLVACGAGAGMAAAYGVPLGGAVRARSAARDTGAAAGVACAAGLGDCDGDRLAGAAQCPDLFHPAIDHVSCEPGFDISGRTGRRIGIGGICAEVIAWADRNRPKGWWRLVAPVMALGLLGLVSIAFPQLLGNGKDVAQLAFTDQLPLALLAALLILKPAATILCLGSGVPGGLFTPSLALGALLGASLGHVCAFMLPGVQPALVAVMGAGAVLAATTQGPISAVVLMMELTGQDRSFIAPLMLAVVIATLVSRAIEPRSIYDARLTDAQIAERQKMREPPRR